MRLPAPLAAALLVVTAGAALAACSSGSPALAPRAPAPPATTMPVSPPVSLAAADAHPMTMALLVDPATTPEPPPIVELRASIAGRENARADAVFQNVKVLGMLSASELLSTMVAFNEALGQRCSFCHAQGGNWASDEKGHKEIARGMITMTHQLNTADLARTQADEGARVTCYTCHRGRPRPQLSPADTVRRRPAGAPAPSGASGNGHS